MKPHQAVRWRWPAGVASWVALSMLSILLPACSPSQAKYAYGWERWLYPSISGRVVDAETGAPIEGAAAFCVWTKQHGLPGMTYTKVAKVSESVTDREGRFRIDGTLDPNVDPPSLTVYTRGYVAWNNKEVFPTRKKRNDFAWESGINVRLEEWQEGYSFIEHEHFMYTYTGFAEIDQGKYRFHHAIEWERSFRVNEWKKRHDPATGIGGGAR